MLERLPAVVWTRLQDLCEDGGSARIARCCAVSSAVRSQCLGVLYDSTLVPSYTRLVALIDALRGPNGKRLRKLVRTLAVVAPEPLHEINVQAVGKAIKRWLPRLPKLQEVSVRRGAARCLLKRADHRSRGTAERQTRLRRGPSRP